MSKPCMKAAHLNVLCELCELRGDASHSIGSQRLDDVRACSASGGDD
jgi:hypothetical protein